MKGAYKLKGLFIIIYLLAISMNGNVASYFIVISTIIKATITGNYIVSRKIFTTILKQFFKHVIITKKS